MSSLPSKEGQHLAACSLLFAMAAALSACGGGNDAPPPVAGPAPAPTPAPAPATGSVTGNVRDAATGFGIAGVTVSSGGSSAQTDASGVFSLPALAVTDRAVLKFDAPGYASTFKPASVISGGSREVQALMLAIGASGTVNPTTGGVVTVAGTAAQVSIPANALVRGDGSAAANSATVEVTPIAPAGNAEVMPGDYTASNGGAISNIESFGALAVSIRENGGAALNLAPGTTSTIRIPVSSRSSSTPATMPLFSLDEASGRWVQQGSATLVAGAQPYYEGTVSHFSYWNADLIMETILFNGCVADATGARLSGVRVTSDGVDYTGSSSVESGTDGSFSVAMKKSALATITGLRGTALTNTVTAGPSATDITRTECLVLSAAGAAAVSVKLTWGESPSDIDSHLFAPDGSHVSYIDTGSLAAAPFANLDVDDTTSFGPEVVTITRLMIGTYRYALHNFSGDIPPGITGSPARVELMVNGTLRVFTPPAGEGASNFWLSVFDLVVAPNCAITITPTQVWSAGEPVPAAPVAATFCTPS